MAFPLILRTTPGSGRSIFAVLLPLTCFLFTMHNVPGSKDALRISLHCCCDTADRYLRQRLRHSRAAEGELCEECYTTHELCQECDLSVKMDTPTTPSGPAQTGMRPLRGPASSTPPTLPWNENPRFAFQCLRDHNTLLRSHLHRTVLTTDRLVCTTSPGHIFKSKSSFLNCVHAESVKDTA